MSRLAVRVLRVAARYQRVAYEFNTPDALKEYLKAHPGADKTLHTVKKPGEHAEKKDEPAKEEKKEHGEGHGEAKPKRSWKDLMSGLSSKAKSFVQNAPKAVQSFVHDENFRRKALQDAHKAITAAPGVFVKKAIEEAKAEATEIKTAGEGLVSLLKGKKLSHEQSHALKKVATHIAIAVAATALTGGLAAGAAALAKGSLGAFTSSLAKKIALKAITPKLEALPTMEELGHAGHGALEMFHHFVEHLAADKADPQPEEAFEAFIAAVVSQGLKDLDADTVAEALEDAAGEG